jgi:hypothetical protein
MHQMRGLDMTRLVAAFLAMVLLVGCSRWNDLASTYSESGDLGIRVSEIAVAPGQYDLRARMTNLFTAQDDPLQSRLPLENAAKARGAILCGARQVQVVSVVQQPPVTDVFMRVECR